MKGEKIVPEVLVDIENAEHLELEHGERFRSWYLTKTVLRKELLPLNYKDLELKYEFVVCAYNIRFIMPPKIEFIGGLISYSSAERKLGIFRFPRDEEGNFCSPISIEDMKKIQMKLTENNIRDLLKRKEPLVFEAFRIPQHVFEFFSVSDRSFVEISDITDKSFSDAIKRQYEMELQKKITIVKEKISSSPNYLLILQNSLNFHWKNLDEVSIVTDKIIHP